MAEFSELVRIKKRLCIKYKSSGCIGCPIDCRKEDLCGIISISGYSDNEFMELEEALLSWAAEHPEPVYELWGEWFEKRGDLIRGWHNATNIQWIAKTFGRLMCTPIPADIAQKLGIEPKEGV